MKNPLYNRKHVQEYFLYGLLAAMLYMAPVIWFLGDNRYENLYYLYIGNALFTAVITWYAYHLIYKPYDGKRAVTMLIAGTVTVLTGILIACILIWLCTFIFEPHLFSTVPTQRILEDAPTTIQPNRPAQLSLMLMLNAVVVNFGTGSFVCVMMSYAGKRNQTKDKPAHLTKNIPKK